jgi:signal peptide peptidase SppA
MPYLHTLNKIERTPWAITPAGYASVRKLIDSKLAGASGGIDFRPTAQSGDGPGSGVQRVNGQRLAMITVSGVLGQRLSWLDKFCGGCDYLDIADAVNQALTDGAEGILFTVDSPGGMVTGCCECASAIADLDVPTVGFSDSLMCSSAYWLAAGCDYLVATRSALVGSIGVIIPWVDETKLWDQLGVKYDPITSKGDTLKSTGGGPSLTDEQRIYLQEMVDQSAADFRGHVLSFRALDFAELRAGAYAGNKAVALNLIDQIGSQTDALNELAKRVSSASEVDKKQ